MNTTYTDTKTGRTWNIVDATEVGPGVARYGWTHHLTLMAPRGRKYHMAAATIEDGAIVRFSGTTVVYK